MTKQDLCNAIAEIMEVDAVINETTDLTQYEEFDSLESLCINFNREPQELKEYLAANGYVYSENQKQFRPIGYDN